MLKAIETKYKGYRFRSRLEARWAVFFDASGIEWLYENEGFALGDSLFYLPDFWLPAHETFVEIKPDQGWDCIDSFDACQRLHEQSQKDVILIAGNCWPREYRIYGFRGSSLGEHVIQEMGWHCSALAKCRRCDGLCYLDFCPPATNDWVFWGDIGKHTCKDHDRVPSEFDEFCYAKARSARFEHGEIP